MTRGPPQPSERGITVRELMADQLRQGPTTARELSVLVGVSEKDVPEHLEHLEKSLKRKGERLVVTPSSCIACGFEFKDRKRLNRPGKCPECGSTRIDPPQFRVERADED